METPLLPLSIPAVFVDSLVGWPTQYCLENGKREAWGKEWCHLWSDDMQALHAIAERIGMRRTWFQDDAAFPHYDLSPAKRLMAIRHGAVERSVADWLKERLSQKHEHVQSISA